MNRTHSATSAQRASPNTRRLLGVFLFGAGVVFAIDQWVPGFEIEDDALRGALLGGGLAALATALGTLPVLLAQRFSQRVFDAMMGFGAGVMLAACAFSLILPALDAAEQSGMSAFGAGGIVGLAVLMGAAMVFAADRAIPHEHFFKGTEGRASAMRRTWLFVMAIVLHNIPEGLSVGVAFGGAEPVAARALSMGIAIQDIPEGLVVALALLSAGYSRTAAAALGAASGLVEPLAAVVGVSVVSISVDLLPWGLAGAAGAMLYVISHEIIPESHRAGHERAATTGLMLGFVLMMFLDTALG